MLDSSDYLVLASALAFGLLYLLRNQLFGNKAMLESEGLRKAISASGQHASSTAASGVGGGGFIDLMHKKESKMIVFYGSQTGTAEDYASRLVKEAAQFGIRATLADLMDYDMSELADLPSDHLVAFVVATYGDGEPTDNAQDFFEWLNDDSESLDNLHYFVFGLGNRTYVHFNAVARLCDSRLKERSATAICQRGEGDDDGDLEEDFVNWKEGMWESVCKFFSIDPSTVEATIVRSFNFSSSSSTSVPGVPSTFGGRKVYHGEHGIINSWSGKQNRVNYDSFNPFYSSVSTWRDLYAPNLFEGGDSDVHRHCVHVELDISGTSLRYQSGDHIALYSPNDADEVDRLAAAMGFTDKLDCVFDMRTSDNSGPVSKRTPFPCPTTLRAALTYYVDISTLPRMHVLALLAKYANDAAEKARLVKLSSRATKEFYHEYVFEASRNLRQVIEEHPSIAFSFDGGDSALHIGDLFEVIPRLQARYYSISSSARCSPTVVHITASVVRYKTPQGRIGNGVVTGHLDSVLRRPQDIPRIPIFLRKSHFKLPKNFTTPILLIGPGTGVAPLRAFIHERQAILKMKVREWLAKRDRPAPPESSHLKPRSRVTVSSKIGRLVVRRLHDSVAETESEEPPVDKMVGDTLLFFGCRHRDEDFLYSDEWVKSVSKLSDALSDSEEEPSSFLHDGMDGLYCAFSRESQKSKTYVQHLMHDYAHDIWERVLAKGGHVYVCGDAKNMARDVNRKLLEIVRDPSMGAMSEDEADQWMKRLKSSGKYQEDVWS